MNKKRINTIIKIYNQAFEDYYRQMIWLFHKSDFSNGKKHVILEDISRRVFLDILRNHEHLKDACDMPNVFSR